MAITSDKITFSFGKNWGEFLKNYFSEERVEISRKHLLEFLELKDLKGKYFLDIGCGSGIHSLAAFKSGAERIVSLDVDRVSVSTTARVREMNGNPPNWKITEGSILDDVFVSQMEPADIVYSWGVLHHTGDIWKAVRNAGSLVKKGGIFYIALYEKTGKSDFWIGIKKKYNRTSWLGKRVMELSYVRNTFFRDLRPRTVLSSLKYIRQYEKNRGMEFWTDIRDWLGGWPYEPSTPQEVTSFCETIGFQTLKIKTGEANIEYLFRKGTAA